MKPQIIGISGSPIKNSNTDRLVQAVLESSGLTSEFVKLAHRVTTTRAMKELKKSGKIIFDIVTVATEN